MGKAGKTPILLSNEMLVQKLSTEERDSHLVCGSLKL